MRLIRYTYILHTADARCSGLAKFSKLISRHISEHRRTSTTCIQSPRRPKNSNTGVASHLFFSLFSDSAWFRSLFGCAQEVEDGGDGGDGGEDQLPITEVGGSFIFFIQRPIATFLVLDEADSVTTQILPLAKYLHICRCLLVDYIPQNRLRSCSYFEPYMYRRPHHLLPSTAPVEVLYHHGSSLRIRKSSQSSGRCPAPRFSCLKNQSTAVFVKASWHFTNGKLNH